MDTIDVTVLPSVVIIPAEITPEIIDEVNVSVPAASQATVNPSIANLELLASDSINVGITSSVSISGIETAAVEDLVDVDVSLGSIPSVTITGIEYAVPNVGVSIVAGTLAIRDSTVLDIFISLAHTTLISIEATVNLVSYVIGVVLPTEIETGLLAVREVILAVGKIEGPLKCVFNTVRQVNLAKFRVRIKKNLYIRMSELMTPLGYHPSFNDTVANIAAGVGAPEFMHSTGPLYRRYRRSS